MALRRYVMVRLIVGNHVDVRPTSGSSYGRTVADLIVEDGPDAGVDAGPPWFTGCAWVEDP